jgi:hypothetical protein
MVDLEVSSNNDTAMTAYIAMRLAHDGVTLTIDEALAELLLIGGIDQAGHLSSTTGGVAIHGGKF